MSNTTVYDVSIRYDLSDKASAGLKAIGENASAAGHNAMSLKDALLGIGGAIAGSALIREGKTAFIDFNSQLEQSVLGIATMDKMFHKGLSMDQALDNSTKLLGEYQEMARKSTGTTMEFIEMHKGLAPALEVAGASVDDFKTVVKGAMLTTGTLAGGRADLMELAIQEILGGNVTKRERVARAILGTFKGGIEEFNRRAKADPAFALNFLKEKFTDPAIIESAKLAEHSWSGALSTLKDNIEITLGGVGKELYELVKGNLNELNNWIDSHQKEIKDFSRDFSHSLVSGFGEVKSLVHVLYENKEVFLAIAGAFAALAGVGVVGGMVKNVVFAALQGNALSVASALLSLGTAAELAAQAWDAHTREVVMTEGDLMAVKEKIIRGEKVLPTAMQMEAEGGFGSAKAAEKTNMILGSMVETVHQWGAFTKDAQVNWDVFGVKAKQMGLTDEEINKFAPMVSQGFQRFMADSSIFARLGLKAPGMDNSLSDQSKKNQEHLNSKGITIGKIEIKEVVSDDPDRFAFGLEKAFKKLAQNKTAAIDALRGGI